MHWRTTITSNEKTLRQFCPCCWSHWASQLPGQHKISSALPTSGASLEGHVCMSHARVNQRGGRTWAEGGYRVSLPPIFQKQLSKNKKKKGKGKKKPHLQRVLSSFFENKMIKGYLRSHPTSDASCATFLLSPLIMHAAAPSFALGWKLHAWIKSKVHYRTSKLAPCLGQACPSIFLIGVWLFARCLQRSVSAVLIDSKEFGRIVHLSAHFLGVKKVLNPLQSKTCRVVSPLNSFWEKSQGWENCT